MSEERWIIHLPTRLTSRERAAELAASLRDSLGHVDVIDFDYTTFSEEHRQNIRYGLHCNLPVDRDPGRCCRRPEGHDGPCDERASAPPG
ncbi:hypothetical protein AB0J86_17005 [Micromonospora sp. NPDC049559]|uniref:hypothetical protein n=1 Tax=Micromonospora sp. NPDC049559 TaxID=3155923 RepID=UPI003439863C